MVWYASAQLNPSCSFCNDARTSLALRYAKYVRFGFDVGLFLLSFPSFFSSRFACLCVLFCVPATLLAYAGLKRLEMAHVATSVLDQEVHFLFGHTFQQLVWVYFYLVSLVSGGFRRVKVSLLATAGLSRCTEHTRGNEQSTGGYKSARPVYVAQAFFTCIWGNWRET